MKRNILTLAAAALLLSACGGKHETPELNSQKDTLSWVVGQSLAQSVRAVGLDLDEEVVVQAVRTTLANGKQPLSEEAYMDALGYLSAMAAASQRSQMDTQLKQAQEQQTQYFKELEKREGIEKTASGIYYEVVKPGKGAKAKWGDVAVFDYRSYTAYDMKLHDQTYGNRESIIHLIADPMMPALQEAMTLMTAGSIYRFFFPFEAMANGEGLPSYMPMMYEVELKKLNPGDNFAPKK